MGERAEPGAVQRHWDHENDGDGDNGNWGWMDGATSGADCESKRLETRPLAERQAGQHEQYKCIMAHVPQAGPSAPSHKSPRHPIGWPNPPRRQRQIENATY